ncbi:MAG: ABC transporter substrate-binding protein [Candidatus Aegiribacteria sp.]|nr:ABC transporter substrate-binding protein [Candidatus Aegiribacteria sp.]
MKNCILLSLVTVLIFLVVSIMGCAPVKDENSPEGLTALAEGAFSSGDVSASLRYYSRAIEDFPDNPLYSSWQFGRGRSLLALDRLEEASEAALHSLRSAIDSHGKASAMLLLSQVKIEQGSFRNGIETLSNMQQDHLDRGESESAVELIRLTLEKVDMDYLTTEPSTGWTEVFFLLELENRYAAEGNTERAILTGMEIDRLFPEAHQRYGRPVFAIHEDGFVALILPLSGEGSTYAERVRSGVDLAFEMSSGLFISLPFLITFDCSGDSADIEEILNSLGPNPSCLAVIGPLTSRNAELAAPLAQRWSLPMITPAATSSELDDYGNYVHRLVVSQGDDAAAVAEYAVRNAGCRTLAIIHEFTSESVANAEQFSSVVQELGSEIVGMEGYESGSTDYKDQINAIKYQQPEGIFLPVNAWDAIQLAPQLRFYRVESQLFGTSGWDDEILLEQGGEYVEGAVFPVSFGSASMNPATARFSYFYERKYDSMPTMLAAQGYDTAEIILNAWKGSIPSRSSLENHLETLNIYFGATGMCTLGSVSIPRSAFPLVRVIDGEIVSIE